VAEKGAVIGSGQLCSRFAALSRFKQVGSLGSFKSAFVLLIEECWKAIAKEGMAEYIKYLFKTVRRFFGEAIVVTQEVGDIISSQEVKSHIYVLANGKALEAVASDRKANIPVEARTMCGCS
jgi:adenosyl cobinamide kinase/adenosyl cobinamide phosphate guanylyltransferase